MAEAEAAAVTATAAAVVSRARAAASRGGKPGYVLQWGVGGVCVGKARSAGQRAAGTGTGTGTGNAIRRGSAPQEQVLGQAGGVCLGGGGVGWAAAPGSK